MLLKLFFLALAILVAIKIIFDFDSLTGVFAMIIGLIRPFLFGFIVAYCINIPVSWFEEVLKKLAAKSKKEKPLLHRLARPISMIVNLTFLIGFIVFGVMSIVPMLYNNVQQLLEEMPEYIEAGIDAVSGLAIARELGIDRQLANFSIGDIFQYLPEINVEQMITGVFSGIFTAFLTVVATIYFLADYNKVKMFIKRLIRAHAPKRQKPVVKYIRLIDSSFRKFLTCQFLDSLVLATITMIAFTIMGSKYAVTLALMLGVLNIIPYFGSIVGSAIAVFIVWATSGLDTAIVVAVTLLIIQQIDGNFINPKIMGTSFKISPVLVIIAITIGGALGGILGMIFAIPVANVLKTILDEYIQNKEKLREKLGETHEQIEQKNKEKQEKGEVQA
jgi:predicted PurR-regulated permease PerM